jgi:O-methyltransferase
MGNIMKQTNPLKLLGKRIIRPLIYRFPPVMMSPNSLYVWFDILANTRELEGDVVEVGCYLGGTAALSARMLKNIESDRDYIVIDTFDGFVEDQFDKEVEVGGADFLRHEFSSNSEALTRWVLDKHGGETVRMIKGDIASLPEDRLPDKISACLLDVDLVDPIYAALSRVYPRLTPGGMVAVDDCDEHTYYKARLGYEKFMKEKGFPIEYKFGMGIVRKT